MTNDDALIEAHAIAMKAKAAAVQSDAFIRAVADDQGGYYITVEHQRVPVKRHQTVQYHGLILAVKLPTD